MGWQNSPLMHVAPSVCKNILSATNLESDTNNECPSYYSKIQYCDALYLLYCIGFLMQCVVFVLVLWKILPYDRYSTFTLNQAAI